MIKISTYGNTDAAATGYPYGKFRDKTTSLFGTTNHADIFLDLYHALAAVIDHSVGAGNMTGTAETTTSSEFLTALLDIISTTVPFGAPGALCLLLYEPTTAKQTAMRVLPNKGQSLLDAEYPEILTEWGSKIFGNADSTHFYLPDDSGQFYRVWDNGAGVDPDAATRLNRGDGQTGDIVGTLQADALQNITGNLGYIEYQTPSGAFGWGGNVVGIRSTFVSSPTINFDASRVARTASETRSKNRYIWAGTYY